MLFPWGMLFDSGLPRAWRGPGENFFRGPYFKIVSGKFFFRTTTTSPPPPPVYNFLGKNFSGCVRCNDFTSIFHTKFRYFAQKNQISCPLSRNISPKKMTGAQQKISRGPQNLGQFAPHPPLGGPDSTQIPRLSGEFNFPLEENMAESKETTKENSRTVL